MSGMASERDRGEIHELHRLQSIPWHCPPPFKFIYNRCCARSGYATHTSIIRMCTWDVQDILNLRRSLTSGFNQGNLLKIK
jgi:hypothetical protein